MGCGKVRFTHTGRDLLAATEADLRKVAKAVARKTKPVRGADRVGLAVGAVVPREGSRVHKISLQGKPVIRREPESPRNETGVFLDAIVRRTPRPRAARS